MFGFKIAIAGIVMFAAGIFIAAHLPAGSPPNAILWAYALSGLGVVAFIFSTAFAVDPKYKKIQLANSVKMTVALISAGVFLAALCVVMLYYVGEIQDFKPYLVYAFAGFIPGVLGIYYGAGYQQDVDLVQMGDKIGFGPADTGPGSEDKYYDIKGKANELAVLANLEQMSGGKNTPAKYKLEILCRVENALKLEFKAGKGNIISSMSLKPGDVPSWDREQVIASNKEAAAQKLLNAKMAAQNVFSEDNGFVSMELKGKEFKFFFSNEGYFHEKYGPEHLKKIIGECSALAREFT